MNKNVGQSNEHRTQTHFNTHRRARGVVMYETGFVAGPSEGSSNRFFLLTERVACTLLYQRTIQQQKGLPNVRAQTHVHG